VQGPQQGLVSESSETGVKRRRTQAEKVGRIKYIIYKLGRLEHQLKLIDDRTKTLVQGLQDFMQFEKGYVEDTICKDEVDKMILQVLLEVGNAGILPSQLSAKLSRYHMDRWRITRRIQRMNKRLRRELGQSVAEKRGHRWAMTSFMCQNWGTKKEEIMAEEPESQ